MQPQFDNYIIPSFLLAVDNKILSQGSGFTNYLGPLFPVTGSYSNYNLYSTPFRQLVNDTSISGANILSGVYDSNGSFLSPPNIIKSINIIEGILYTTGIINSPSGNYAIKDYSIYLSNAPEEKLLFETKYSFRQLTDSILSGLGPDVQTCPAIFVKPIDSTPKPFALGGVDKRIHRVRNIILGDSLFFTDAICSIMLDMAHKNIKLVDFTKLPFDSFNGYTGTHYNYNNLSGIGQTYIQDVKISRLFNTRELNELNPAIFPAFADFELWTWK